MHRADDGEPVLRLRVADRVTAGEQSTRRAHLRVGRREDLPEHLERQLFGERGDRKREQRGAAHREHVVQRVRGGDRAVVARVVDDRREEVEGEDQRTLVVEPVDGCVVRRGETDKEVLLLHGKEAPQQLLEASGRILRGAASAGCEVGQLHTAGLGAH